MKSKYPGVCSLCGLNIEVGHDLSRWGYSWEHTYCVDIARTTNQINEGITYAATPKPFRRKPPKRH